MLVDAQSEALLHSRSPAWLRWRVAPERAHSPLSWHPGVRRAGPGPGHGDQCPHRPPEGLLRGPLPSACEPQREPGAPQCDRGCEGRKRAFNYLQNIAIWLESITPELVSFLSPQEVHGTQYWRANQETWAGVWLQDSGPAMSVLQPRECSKTPRFPTGRL